MTITAIVKKINVDEIYQSFNIVDLLEKWIQLSKCS